MQMTLKAETCEKNDWNVSEYDAFRATQDIILTWSSIRAHWM